MSKRWRVALRLLAILALPTSAFLVFWSAVYVQFIGGEYLLP